MVFRNALLLRILSGINYLQTYPPSYTPRMDLRDIRRQLRAERKARGFTQDEVAEDAKVAQATVSRLENLDVEMSEIEFETIRKLVELGLGMTMADFFSKIESQTNADLSDQAIPSRTALPRKEHVKSEQQGRASHAASIPPAITIGADQLVKLGRIIGRAIRADARDQSAAAARPRQPKHRARRPRNA